MGTHHRATVQAAASHSWLLSCRGSNTRHYMNTTLFYQSSKLSTSIPVTLRVFFFKRWWTTCSHSTSLAQTGDGQPLRVEIGWTRGLQRSKVECPFRFAKR